ncbi:MAG: hypothetical protein QXX59_06535 [Candidatus Bathyarchaeia archaeon]
MDCNRRNSSYRKQTDNKGKSKNPPLVDPLPALKEKMLAHKCRELARQLLKRKERKKRKNPSFNIVIVKESRR